MDIPAHLSSHVAICYDFDRTLTPLEMQAQGFIQSLGLEVSEFWHQSDTLALQKQMDNNLAYMYLMLKHHPRQCLKKTELVACGKNIELYRGLTSWFSRLNHKATEHGLTLEHYVISSGLKEMIEATPIASEFKKIYANSFLYNEQGEAVWPAQIINYTNKTQFMFRISKGLLEVNDEEVNSKVASYRIPFSQIIYIGDSQTDVPCMKLLKTFHGYPIGVYDLQRGDLSKVATLFKEERISFYAPADYQDGSELDLLIKSILERIACEVKLNALQQQCFNRTDLN